MGGTNLIPPLRPCVIAVLSGSISPYGRCYELGGPVIRGPAAPRFYGAEWDANQAVVSPGEALG